MRYAVLLSALLAGCSAERPAWWGGELVPPAELRPAVEQAAAWWNAEAGSAWVVADACSGPSCVRFERAPCPTGADACSAWESTPFAEQQAIRVRPDAPIDDPRFPLLMAHELGHVMGFDHETRRPNVMWTGDPDGLAWELP